jgi:alanine dehydrogenase
MTATVDTLLLRRSDVGALVPPEDCIGALEEAWRASTHGSAGPSGVLGVHVPFGGFHVKTASLHGERHYVAAKLNANFPENPARHGLPTIQGVVALFDGDDGRLLALLDSTEVTRLRTAAATAVAAKHLSRPDAGSVMLFGCGVQGRAQLQALARVRALRRIVVCDVDRSAARGLAAVLGVELGLDIEVADPEALDPVRDSDLVVTCTPARAPFLRPEHVRPGTFIAAVGADREDKQELDVALLAAGHVVVDALEQCAATGELHHALDAGVVTRADVRAELADVVTGRVPGRVTAEEITIFDSTGTGLQDVATAALAFERALAAGRGTHVTLGG